MIKDKSYKKLVLGITDNKDLVSAAETMARSLLKEKGNLVLTGISDAEGALRNALSSYDRYSEVQSKLSDLAMSDVVKLQKRLADSLKSPQDIFEAQLGAHSTSMRYVLPDGSAISDLLRHVDGINLAPHLSAIETLEKSMAAMKYPWLDVTAPARSVSGFLELQNLGKMARSSEGFNSAGVLCLRDALGDWRQSVKVPKEAIDNPLAREGFYKEQGLDPSLIDFPSDAFLDGLVLSGLVEPEENDSDYEVRAFSIIRKLEIKLRNFITVCMCDVYGNEWFSTQVPPDVRRDCIEKRDRARNTDKDVEELIQYLDFTHYEKIILRKDNWRTVFKAVFKRQSNIQESLCRLYPVRLATMHSRSVSKADMLYLCAENARIFRAIDDSGVPC